MLMSAMGVSISAILSSIVAVVHSESFKTKKHASQRWKPALGVALTMASLGLSTAHFFHTSPNLMPLGIVLSTIATILLVKCLKSLCVPSSRGEKE